MSDQFKLYIERIRDGQSLPIQEQATPTFLAINESDLSFNAPVLVSGQASVAGDQLVIQLSIQTTASLPCTICNERTEFSVVVNNFYHMEQIEDLRSPIFDYTAPLRETILLSIPQFIECNEGSCPDRKDISKYLSNPSQKEANVNKKPDCYYPFGNLPS